MVWVNVIVGVSVMVGVKVTVNVLLGVSGAAAGAVAEGVGVAVPVGAPVGVSAFTALIAFVGVAVVTRSATLSAAGVLVRVAVATAAANATGSGWPGSTRFSPSAQLTISSARDETGATMRASRAQRRVAPRPIIATPSWGGPGYKKPTQRRSCSAGLATGCPGLLTANVSFRPGSSLRAPR